MINFTDEKKEDKNKKDKNTTIMLFIFLIMRSIVDLQWKNEKIRKNKIKTEW